MNTKDEEAEDEYSTDEFEESMDGDVDTKAAAQDYESDEFEVCFEKKNVLPTRRSTRTFKTGER